MSYYLLHFIRIINESIIEAILNQYVPNVKIINSTVFTSVKIPERTPMQHVEKTELINK